MNPDQQAELRNEIATIKASDLAYVGFAAADEVMRLIALHDQQRDKQLRERLVRSKELREELFQCDVRCNRRTLPS